jgi:hypothetical protein
MITVRLAILFRDSFETAKHCWQKIITEGKRVREDVYQYKGYEFHFHKIRPTYIFDGRNDAITDYSIDGNTRPLKYDFFGFIDADVKCKNDSDDIVKALKHNKDIIAGCYLGQLSERYLTWELDRYGKINKWYGPGDLKGLCEVGATATGFMFIKRRVFTRIPGPWFWHPLSKHEWKPLPEDLNFCLQAKKYKFKIYVDAGIKLHHEHRTADQHVREKSKGSAEAEKPGGNNPQQMGAEKTERG